MTMFNGKKIRKLAQYSSCELSLHKKTKLFYMSFFLESIQFSGHVLNTL